MTALEDTLEGLAEALENGYRPDKMTTQTLGVCGITYHFDPEQNEPYALLGLTLPGTTIYAEIEDGTYGSLNGIRIYMPYANPWDEARQEVEASR